MISNFLEKIISFVIVLEKEGEPKMKLAQIHTLITMDKKGAVTTVKTIPATNPSTVFLGEIVLNNLILPKFLPITNAKVSLIQTKGLKKL